MLLALKNPAKLVFPLHLFICHNWMLLEKSRLHCFPRMHRGMVQKSLVNGNSYVRVSRDAIY